MYCASALLDPSLNSRVMSFFWELHVASLCFRYKLNDNKKMLKFNKWTFNFQSFAITIWVLWRQFILKIWNKYFYTEQIWFLRYFPLNYGTKYHCNETTYFKNKIFWKTPVSRQKIDTFEKMQLYRRRDVRILTMNMLCFPCQLTYLKRPWTWVVRGASNYTTNVEW